MMEINKREREGVACVRTVEGSCEYGDELSRSIKVENLLTN
jgi:hypothetical protein